MTQIRKRYTVAVDFDGVLHSYTSPWVAPHVIPDPPVPGAIEWLRRIASDFDVAIFSARGRTWRGRRAMRHWLWLQDTGGVGSQAAWEDIDLLGTRVKFVKKKPTALIYVDDRGYRFEGPGTFPTRDEIHRARPWNKRGIERALPPTMAVTLLRSALNVVRTSRIVEGSSVAELEAQIEELRCLAIDTLVRVDPATCRSCGKLTSGGITEKGAVCGECVLQQINDDALEFAAEKYAECEHGNEMSDCDQCELEGLQ